MRSTLSLAEAVELLARNGARFDDRAITYSFWEASPDRGYGGLEREEQPTFVAFDTQARVNAVQALLFWEELADIDIRLAREGVGDVRFGAADLDDEAGLAWSRPRGRGVDVWMDSATGAPGYDSARPLGTPGFKTLLHETGHALGLAHPGAYNGAGAVDRSDPDDPLRPHDRDNQQYTVMSYFSDRVTGADWGDQFAETPMVHDIAAIQQLYGANTTTRVGDNTYGYDAAGADMHDVFDFDKNRAPVLSIWDAGGHDVFDLSGSLTANRVDLRPGAYSDVNGLTSNVGIAHDVIIEEVVGGVFDDILVGNGERTFFRFSLGNDQYVGINSGWLYLNKYTLSLSSDDLGLQVNFDTPRNGDIQFNGLFGIQNQRFFNIDIVFGSDLDDIFIGTAGEQVVFAGHGDDRLVGGADGDVLRGGAGYDWLDYTDAPSRIYLDFRTGTSSSTSGHDRDDRFAGIEGVIGSAFGDIVVADAERHRVEEIRFVGGPGADVLRGGPGLEGSRYADTLRGDRRDNLFEGGLGGDRIWGRAGNDRFMLGEDGDTVFGGAGSDTVVYVDLTRAELSIAPTLFFSTLGVSTAFEAVGPHGRDTLYDVEYVQFGEAGTPVPIASYGDVADPFEQPWRLVEPDAFFGADGAGVWS